MLVLQTESDLVIAKQCVERGVAEWVVDSDHNAYAIIAKHDKDYQKMHETANKMGAHFCETAHSHIYTGGLRQIVDDAKEFSTHIQDWFISRINHELREMTEITRYYVGENIILYESVLERIKEHSENDIAGKMAELEDRVRIIEDYVSAHNGSMMGMFTPTRYDMNIVIYFVKTEANAGKLVVALCKAKPFVLVQDYMVTMTNEHAIRLLHRVKSVQSVENKGSNLLSVYARSYPIRPSLSYLTDFTNLLVQIAKE